MAEIDTRHHSRGVWVLRMSLRGTIRRSDGKPLGTVAEVQRRLSEAFPGTGFIYEASAPAGQTEAGKSMSLLLRLWLVLFGVDRRYPCYRGSFQRSEECAVQFYFSAHEPVAKISATSYGMTSGLDDDFDRLAEATGWIVKYPRF
jgi:hypothetical protein